MEKLNDSEPNIDLLVQMVKDIFDMSVKAMDQTARTGAFHHLIRRRATLLDTGLEDITELNDKFLSLKLSSDGVLGKDFEEKLKNRSETYKQIKYLLPELNRKSTASTSGFKRKSTVIHTSQDTNGPEVAKMTFQIFAFLSWRLSIVKIKVDLSLISDVLVLVDKRLMMKRKVLFVTMVDQNDYKKQVKILCQNPEIPVGGRLKLFFGKIEQK
ncbi:unnamed protein product [Mytilus coruscus]|uniref:Uncharacterized protein n=1 Tax=Mytilus coruscus TaxID=42192 RepID=A0A6J8CIN6_MYTCO|nr:unnamed protein product [Mytilus coruscus]